MVGNDIVDLHFPDSPPYQHVNHLTRVCSAMECDLVRNADQPSVTLASLWAAKEAAFKLFAKGRMCRFIPQRFAVHLDGPVEQDATQTGVVSFEGSSAAVRLFLRERWLHAVAFSAAASRICWAVRDVESCYDHKVEARHESAAVRILAAELVSKYCSQEVLPRFDGGVPVLTNKDGSRAAVNISFSHHGKFAAVVLAWLRVVPRDVHYETIRRSERAGEEVCSTSTA